MNRNAATDAAARRARIPTTLRAYSQMNKTTKRTIGTIPRIRAHDVANVCYRPLPMPTVTDSASSPRTPAERLPVGFARIQAGHAANWKDAMVTVFSGSASNPGPIRSR